MPIVVKKSKGDSNRNVINDFKKSTKNVGIVEMARDNRYFEKPSQKRAKRQAEFRHRKKRLKTLKNMKNASQAQIRRLQEG